MAGQKRKREEVTPVGQKVGETSKRTKSDAQEGVFQTLGTKGKAVPRQSSAAAMAAAAPLPEASSGTVQLRSAAYAAAVAALPSASDLSQGEMQLSPDKPQTESAPPCDTAPARDQDAASTECPVPEPDGAAGGDAQANAEDSKGDSSYQEEVSGGRTDSTETTAKPLVDGVAIKPSGAKAVASDEAESSSQVTSAAGQATEGRKRKREQSAGFTTPHKKAFQQSDDPPAPSTPSRAAQGQAHAGTPGSACPAAVPQTPRTPKLRSASIYSSLPPLQSPAVVQQVSQQSEDVGLLAQKYYGREACLEEVSKIVKFLQ